MNSQMKKYMGWGAPVPVELGCTLLLVHECGFTNEEAFQTPPLVESS